MEDQAPISYESPPAPPTPTISWPSSQPPRRRWGIEVIKFLGIFLGFFIVISAIVMGPTLYTQFTYYFDAPQENYSEKYDLPVAARDSFADIADLSTFFEQQDFIAQADTIIIPKINVDAPIIYPESRDNSAILDTIQNGVAHYAGTAMPGRLGNVFLTGHSSYYWWSGGKYNQVFGLLHQVESGDLVYIYYQGKKFIYKVTDAFVVLPNQVDVLEQPQDKALLTLMTCTPIGTNLRRLIVRAELVGQPPIASEALEDFADIPNMPTILPLY
ncbi:MAG: class D sortase [bacterium]